MRKPNLLRALGPRIMPDFSSVLEELGNPSAAQLSNFLGVDVRTVRRWQASRAAPRPAMLALFWLTRWGRSQVECQAVNDARLAAMQARAALAQLEAATKQNAHLMRVGVFGSSNSPQYGQ